MMNEGMYLPQMTNTISSFPHHNNPSEIAEEAARRREIRLLKNREAARECRQLGWSYFFVTIYVSIYNEFWLNPFDRRKKKEYVKCLENRVEVLETQNRALIEELKTLKDIHCSSTGGSSDGRSTTSPMTSLKQELRWAPNSALQTLNQHEYLSYLTVNSPQSNKLHNYNTTCVQFCFTSISINSRYTIVIVCFIWADNQCEQAGCRRVLLGGT